MCLKTIAQEGSPMTSRLTGARWAALVSVVAASAAFIPGIANADEAIAPPTEKITLDVQTVNGSGCPAGTAHTYPSADNTGFRIYYDDFEATTGPGSAAGSFRQACQVNVNVHIPQGYTFAVARSDYNGRANLPAGTKALVRSNYYYQGESADAYVDHILYGQINGTWRTTDVTPVEELVWSPCGETRNLNIKTEIQIAAPATTKTSVSLKSQSDQVYTLVNFQWEKC
jgi:uncharacterized protein DUF4360